MLQGISTTETREAAREVKFLVAPDLAASMLDWARARLPADPHGGGDAGDEYATTTVYFDTPALAVYHRQGSYRRSKYRVRRYGASDVAFLERKLRTARLLNKRRTIVPLDDLHRAGERPIDPLWAGAWFAQRLDARHLTPVCQVAYRRHALVQAAPWGQARLTFDAEIVAQPARGLRFDPQSGVPVSPDVTIVEMKYRVQVPAVFKALVEIFSLRPCAVSKYRRSIEALAAAGLHLDPGHGSDPAALHQHATGRGSARA